MTPEAKAWLVSLACDKAKEHGYAHELWTTRLLARHARVYREVQVLKKAGPPKSKKPGKPVAVVSYDEKPGMSAIATTAPDLPPEPGRLRHLARDHEYKRYGALSLLAGDRSAHREGPCPGQKPSPQSGIIEFLKLLDAAYPARTAMKLILDNHSAHISRETRTWLPLDRPALQFTFTPKHGSWLNLVEGFFSKFARSVLRHIRVASKHELKERIMAGIEDVNRHPVIHTWSYKLAEAA